MISNPRYINEINGILVTQDDGIDLYIDTGELYDQVVNGDYGPISPYIPQTAAEILAAKRNKATKTRREFYQALIREGLYEQVKALETDPLVPLEIRVDLIEATSFDRMYPSLVSMASNMGITDETLDLIFGIV